MSKKKRNSMTLAEVKYAMTHPETWYVPYIPLMITTGSHSTKDSTSVS